MSELVRGAGVRSSTFSLFALKPRQVILAELKKSSEEVPSMEEVRQENAVNLKAQQEFVLACSVALWLENKGFSKVLKRFISAAQIQDDDWKAKALNLEEVFAQYNNNCNNLHIHLNPGKKREDRRSVITENGETMMFAESDEIAYSKKKKKKTRDVLAANNESNPEEIAVSEKANGPNLKSKELKNSNTSGTLGHDELKSKKLKQTSDEKACDLSVESINDSAEKQKDKKRMKKKLQSVTTDEKKIKEVSEVTKYMPNGVLSKLSVDDPEVISKLHDKSKKKKLKRDVLVGDDIRSDNTLSSDKDAIDIGLKDQEVQTKGKSGKEKSRINDELTISGEETLDMENPVDRKSKKASAKAEKDNGESKSSKKRKRSTADENEKLPDLETADEETMRKKTKCVEPEIKFSGANGHASDHIKVENFNIRPSESQNLSPKPTGESLARDLGSNGTEKPSAFKSSRKNHSSTDKPKTVNAFQRVKTDEVIFVDERLQDNSYWAKNGAENGYGAKAQEVLGQVKGRGFRHEKTKKKRGSYRGGQIDLDSHSIKFNYSDDE